MKYLNEEAALLIKRKIHDSLVGGSPRELAKQASSATGDVIKLINDEIIILAEIEIAINLDLIIKGNHGGVK